MNITPISSNFNKTKLNSKQQTNAAIKNSGISFACDILEIKPRIKNTSTKNDFDAKIIEYDFKKKKPKTKTPENNKNIFIALKDFLLEPFKLPLGCEDKMIAEDISKAIDKKCIKILKTADKNYDIAEKEIKKFDSYLKLGKENRWRTSEAKTLLLPETVKFEKANKKDKLPSKMQVLNSQDVPVREYEITDENNYTVTVFDDSCGCYEVEIQNKKPYSYIETTLKKPIETFFIFKDNDDFVYEEINYDKDDYFDNCSIAFRTNPKKISKSEYVKYDKENDTYEIYTIDKKTKMWELTSTSDYYPFDCED